nr:hypothetical protein [Pedobacter frigoris]
MASIKFRSMLPSAKGPVFNKNIALFAATLTKFLISVSAGLLVCFE